MIRTIEPLHYTLDACEGRYSRFRPTIAALQDDEGTCVAVLDGGGSWGCGVEAAVWAREQLMSRWEHPSQVTVAGALADIDEVFTALPGELHNAEFGSGFSLSALLIHGRNLHWIAAGSFGISLVREKELLRLFRARMLVDELEDSGRWGARRLRGFPHANVLTGRLIGDPEQPPECGGPLELRVGDRIVVARERVHRELLPHDLHAKSEAMQDAAIFAGLRPAAVAVLEAHPAE